MNNPTTIMTRFRPTSQPPAITAAAEAIESPAMDIMPTLAVAGAVIAAKVAMLALLIHAV